MGYPVFASGDVLTAADMNAVGMWKADGATFTGATTFDVTGFSSNYNRYRLMIQTRRVDTTGMGTFVAKLHNGGTPISTGYYEGTASFSYLGTVASAYTRNNGSDWVFGNSDSAFAQSLWTYDLAGNSTLGLTFVMSGASVGEAKGYNGGGMNNTSSAFDRIRITYDYGTHTGRWILYGYKD